MASFGSGLLRNNAPFSPRDLAHPGYRLGLDELIVGEDRGDHIDATGTFFQRLACLAVGRHAAEDVIGDSDGGIILPPLLRARRGGGQADAGGGEPGGRQKARPACVLLRDRHGQGGHSRMLTYRDVLAGDCSPPAPGEGGQNAIDGK